MCSHFNGVPNEDQNGNGLRDYQASPASHIYLSDFDQYYVALYLCLRNFVSNPGNLTAEKEFVNVADSYD